jgi:multidrug efflux system outer membrane protein
MRASLPALAAALLAAGCVNIVPPYERPAPPVAERFPSAAANESSVPATELAWRDFFGADERLRRLIELALADNRDLRVAVLNIEAARAQFALRDADRLPSVNAAVIGNRQPGSGGNIVSTYSAGLAVPTYELDLFGRVRAASEAALAQLEASEAARRAAHIALVASVANAHFALRGDDELIALTERTLANRRDSLDLVQLRVRYGIASDLDLRAAQTSVETARAALLQLRRQRALDRNALELLLGRPLPGELPPAAPWNPQALGDVPAGVPSQVLLKRPDVEQAEDQLRAAQANIGVARAAFFPRITLTGSVGIASSHLSDLFSGGSGAWTFMPQLVAPLFDAGRNRANLKFTQTQRDIAVAQYERAVQAAFRDVADTLAGRATLEEQRASAQALVDAEADRQRLVDLRFRNGAAGSLELLDAQRSLFVAQQQLVQVELQLLLNRVAAYRALGGGWGG